MLLSQLFLNTVYMFDVAHPHFEQLSCTFFAQVSYFTCWCLTRHTCHTGYCLGAHLPAEIQFINKPILNVRAWLVEKKKSGYVNHVEPHGHTAMAGSRENRACQFKRLSITWSSEHANPTFHRIQQQPVCMMAPYTTSGPYPHLLGFWLRSLWYAYYMGDGNASERSGITKLS